MKIIDFFKKDDQRATIYLIGQALTQILATVSVLIFGRILPAREYGIVAVYTTWSTFLTYFIGLQAHGTLGIAKVHKTDVYKEYCGIPYVLTLLTSAAMCGAALLGHRQIERLSDMSLWIVLFMIIHTTGLVCFHIQNSIYRLDMKAVSYVANNLLVNVASIGLSVVLVIIFKSERATGRILGLGIPYIVWGACFGAQALKRGISHKKELYQYCVRLSIPLIFHGISAQILSHSDTLMLASMCDETEAGIYSFCYSIASPLTGIWSAFNTAWQPDYLQNAKSKNGEWIREHSGNYLFTFTALVCGYILIGQDVLRILGAREYWKGAGIITLITIATYFQFLYSFPCNYEFFMGRTKMIAIGTVISAAVNVAINWMLIPAYGIYAAALSTIAAYGVLFLLHDFFARRLGSYHYRWSFYLKGIAPVAGCAFVSYLCAEQVLLRWGIGVMVVAMLAARLWKKKALL